MSYSCGPPRVNYFSNPGVIHLNKPTGTPMDNNARVIVDNMVRGKNDRQPNTSKLSCTVYHKHFVGSLPSIII